MAKVNKVRTKPNARRSVERESVDYHIPSSKELNEPSDSLFDYAICLYGKKGIGKTSLAAQFPDNIVFQFERSRRNLKIRQIPRRHADGSVDPPLVWDSDLDGTPFRPILRKALKDDSIRSIIIDTGDRCYESAFQWCCSQEGVKHPPKKDGYELWNTIKNEFEDAIGSILDVGKTPIIISHARIQEIQSQFGEGFDMVTTTMSPAAWKLIQTFCDFVFYYDYYEGRRCLKVRGDELIQASNQVQGHFLDPDGNPVNLIDMGKTAEESFANLCASFDNKIYDITYKPEPSPGTKKRVKRLEN